LRGGVPPRFLLGATRWARFVKDVFSVVHVQNQTASSFLDTFSSYPQWVQAACLTVVAALAIWILGKLLKIALWVLLFVVLIGGTIATLWLLFH